MPVTLSQAFLTTSARLSNQLCLQFVQDPPGSAQAQEIGATDDRSQGNYRPIKQKQAKIFQYSWDVFY